MPKKSRAEPRFIEPMQCKPVTSLPTAGEWTYEIKFDGYRCMAVKLGDEVTLFSRNEKILNGRFPCAAEALSSLPGKWTIDGELVALDSEGRPSFQLLQNTRTNDLTVYFYAFDLLNRDGKEFLNIPIERRRKTLNEFLSLAEDPVRLSPLLDGTPEQMLDAVQKLGLEGVVGKRVGSLYEAGERTGSWIKRRTNREEEFIIGGYIPGTRGFDALLVGIFKGEELHFVARVKNGFVPRAREDIFKKLKPLRIPASPFVNLPEPKSSRGGESLTAEKMKECRWIKPKLVARLDFVEWTDAGHLRHCTFVSLQAASDR